MQMIIKTQVTRKGGCYMRKTLCFIFPGISAWWYIIHILRKQLKINVPSFVEIW